MSPRLSVVVPVLNEADEVLQRLGALTPLRPRGSELIVVDGGSTDATGEVARPLADQLVHAPRGRAVQMNAGAMCGRGQILLFLHLDTTLPPDADRLIYSAVDRGAAWGRFDVRIEGDHPCSG